MEIFGKKELVEMVNEDETLKVILGKVQSDYNQSGIFNREVDIELSKTLLTRCCGNRMIKLIPYYVRTTLKGIKKREKTYEHAEYCTKCGEYQYFDCGCPGI
jgi:hypothetical protein